MSFFSSIMDTGTKIFSWMEDNPTATSFISGAALGALQYQQIKEQRKEAQRDRDFQRQLRDEEREYRSQFGGASTTEAGFEQPKLLGEGGALTDGSIVSLSDGFGG